MQLAAISSHPIWGIASSSWPLVRPEPGLLQQRLTDLHGARQLCVNHLFPFPVVFHPHTSPNTDNVAAEDMEQSTDVLLVPADTLTSPS